jgi:hypothetical protein
LILVTDPATLESNERPAYLVGGGEGVRIPCVHASQRVGNALLGLVGDTLRARQEAMEREGRPQPAEIPHVEVELATDVTRGDPVCRNVIGLLRGCDPDIGEECVVIGAHYDHLGFGDVGAMGGKPGDIYYGADDNASGTTAVIEAARAFGSCPIRPKRSIVFVCFTGEEVGLFGSSHYAKNPLVPLADTVAMINLDMVGRVRSDRLTVMGAGSGEGFEPMLLRANEGLGLDLTLPKQGYAGSDHTPFYTRKVPAVFLFSGVHPDYHKSSDTSDKINFDGLARVVKLAYLMAVELASASEPPAFKAAPSSGRRNRRGPKLGIMPDFGFDGSGARIATISPDSPADRAGLEDGDVIVSFDGKPVESMQDLVRLLGATKPGAAVKIEYRRGSQTRETEVRFGR